MQSGNSFSKVSHIKENGRLISTRKNFKNPLSMIKKQSLNFGSDKTRRTPFLYCACCNSRADKPAMMTSIPELTLLVKYVSSDKKVTSLDT